MMASLRIAPFAFAAPALLASLAALPLGAQSAADVLARFYRLTGREVFFLTGLDEHGQKVQQAAAKAGIDPQAHCDKLAPQFQDLWKRLNISNDAFIRTTDERHRTSVLALWAKLLESKAPDGQSAIYKGK